MLEGFTTGILLLFVNIIFGAFIVGVVGAIIWWFIYYRRFSQYKVLIFERDGFGELRATEDGAGIFVDRRTQNKRFFIKKAKIGLCPDNIPYLPIGKTRVVWLFKKGLKNYHFLKPKIDADGIMSIGVGEEDVNWAIHEYEKHKLLFTTNKFMQYAPYILFFGTVMLIMVLLIYFFKQFSVLADVGNSLVETAKIIAGASSGTVVLPG